MQSIQQYVIKFRSDLRQISGFHRVHQCPPPIKLTHDIIDILLKVALNIITLTHTVHMNSRGNVSWCNASDFWSSRENLIINTSKIILRRIVSQSVNSYHNRYHDLNDAHDTSMKSADNRHSTDICCVASAYKWTSAGNCHRLRCFFLLLFVFV